VTGVLNVAPGACDDPVHAYAVHGIVYGEHDAEDFEGYPLLEIHLAAVNAFMAEHTSGRVLLHCFAGVNRSAALAIAVMTQREPQRPLLSIVQECFERRPFILSNKSFRRQLLRHAARCRQSHQHCDVTDASHTPSTSVMSAAAAVLW